jgi:hypothetical protein
MDPGKADLAPPSGLLQGFGGGTEHMNQISGRCLGP